jgi:benzoate-CoA ligase family protein
MNIYISDEEIVKLSELLPNAVVTRLAVVSKLNIARTILYAGENGNKIVYRYGDEDITRTDLQEIVLKLANYFKVIGIEKGTRVLLLLHDTPAFSASFLAALWIGAVPVPITPRSKPETLSYIVQDSGARFLIVEEDCLPAINQVLNELENCPQILLQNLYIPSTPSIPKGVIALSNGLDSLGTVDCVESEPSDIVFWLYTSGTTGKPKAVMHNAIGMLANTELFAARILGIGPGDMIYSASKMFFAYGLGNSFFFPLLLGSTAVLDREWPTPTSVAYNISNYRPSVFCSVPAMYHVLLGCQDKLDRIAISAPRLFVSAGTHLPASIFERWQKLTDKKILDGLGATEVGHIFLTNDRESARPGSTGSVVPGYELRIETADGTEVAKGKEGVLWVRGPSISAGYWQKTNTTKERFQHGWYRTGDMFSCDADGYYYCHGREDDLFKVKGRWVVPAEIEGLVYSEFSDVTEAVLVPVNDHHGLTQPVLVLRTGLDEDKTKILCDQIAEFLRHRVEQFKNPSAIHIVTDFPRNDNGKILRKELSMSIEAC